MARKKVYIETSVISFLAARPSRDIIKLAKQELTRQWWRTSRKQFDLYVSTLVIEEITGGDAQAARQRLDVAADLPVINVTDAAAELYEKLIAANWVSP